MSNYTINEEFQFTPLREGRLKSNDPEVLDALFQFTPLREGRRAFVKGSGAGINFNSRPCVRGDAARKSR